MNMGRPRQAVILAGGRGTRLAPLTDTRPKPMIEFHGKPFLEYLIIMLREQGFTRILLLLGYLSEMIQEYFGDGSQWGVSIEYSVSSIEDDTGLRMKRALSRLEPVFVLMYCDNYWPMRFDRMWDKFRESPASAMVTVYENIDGYTRSNLRVDADGFVVTYDKTRSEAGLKGVDIGFLILRRELVEGLPDGNISFEASLYPALVKNHQLLAFVTGHRYYSVGNHERLPLTNEFLAHKPAVILDRDGVLNKKMPRARYVRTWHDWEWLPGAKDALRNFAEAGFRVIIITNQAGIARGEMTEQDLADIHEHMCAEMVCEGGRIDAIYHCPHGWDEGCDCRKPKPGMLFRAQRDFHLDLTKVFFVGDDERDAQAAESAGCCYEMVAENKPLCSIAKQIIEEK